MSARQRIVRERRQYNKWVASQTLEDYALRFTAARGRRWTASRIAQAAIGASSFLACEALGAAITLSYGFANAAAAIAAAMVLMFVIGLPITYSAAKHGLDIDLLSRGAGFGYLGSTFTSLIYASFTFLLFAIEASIMSEALSMVLGLPIALAHVISALVVIPIAIYGMSRISRFQVITQPVWLLLQGALLVFVLLEIPEQLPVWQKRAAALGVPSGAVDLLPFGLALSTLLSLLPQIGEQADYLRFLPSARAIGQRRWWTAMLLGGPGWVLFGGIKLLLGAVLALFAIAHGMSALEAVSPGEMFHLAFTNMTGSSGIGLALTGILVVVCQMKINVTNAYAGSIAWSNFFSRLTHNHPGRVVWLVFNVLLALLLMEIGIFAVIEGILVVFANLAAGWIGALAADLTISKPLGLSPRHIEFRRAHLYDINPVGVGALALSVVVSTLSLVGAFGALAQAFAPLLGLTIAFVAAPAIAVATHSRFYLARPETGLPEGKADIRCAICENRFERADMAYCPAYGEPICSLCCTLEARCHDLCKSRSTFAEQVTGLLQKLLPERLARLVHTTTGHFVGLVLLFNLAIGCILYLIYVQYGLVVPESRSVISTTLWIVYGNFLLLSGVAAWLMVLAHESRRAAEQESKRQTAMLMEEVAAHRKTDAALQKAKEAAEAANAAKSRYLVGVSHEIRSPLNSIYGYAQLLERGASITPEEAGRVIRRSAEHLTNLVEGLLDISRIEAGVMRLSRDKVRLPEFLEQTVDMFEMQARTKGIEFRYEVAGRIPDYVFTDQKRLRQVLVNLLSNAVKYTREGHAGLRVKYRSQIATFEVFDTGIGINAEDVERIFEPFERGSMDQAKAMPGVGLGLAITKMLTQIMGGEITVISQPGKGSRFIVRLMLPEPLTPPEEAAPAPRRTVGYAGARRTVLVVDDTPTHLAVLENLLRPLGFVVFTASSGPEALALFPQCKPDLVILDIAMPGMTGWEVAARLREIGPEGLKIVMVSANAHELEAGQEREDGERLHDAFVLKPFEVGVLLRTLGNVLGLAWQQEEAGAVRDAASARGRAVTDIPEQARAFVNDLYRLGRIGHVRGIEAKLCEMEAAHPANAAFASQLRQLIKSFDLKSYLKLLDGVKQDG